VPLGSSAIVLAIYGPPVKRHGKRPCQVRFRKASASELLLRCRNEMDDVKTGGRTGLQDKFKGNLFTA
jgi:hypothetical protein